MSNLDKIMLAALRLSKVHTQWKTGKVKVDTFSRAKSAFHAEVQIELYELHRKGWNDAFEAIKDQAPGTGHQ